MAISAIKAIKETGFECTGWYICNRVW